MKLSYCRICRYYQPTGRRGGMCQLLSVPVRSGWMACSCSALPFGKNQSSASPIVQKSNPEWITVGGI